MKKTVSVTLASKLKKKLNFNKLVTSNLNETPQAFSLASWSPSNPW